VDLMSDEHDSFSPQRLANSLAKNVLTNVGIDSGEWII
jgi:hypothetical protein